jgi:hypothetical protein
MFNRGQGQVGSWMRGQVQVQAPHWLAIRQSHVRVLHAAALGHMQGHKGHKGPVCQATCHARLDIACHLAVESLEELHHVLVPALR